MHAETVEGFKTLLNHRDLILSLPRCVYAEKPCTVQKQKQKQNLTCTRGDSPCTGGIQLTSRSEGRCTYLVSFLQMTLYKRVRTPKFSSPQAWIEPGTSSTRGKCLITELGPSINGLVTDGNTKLCCRGFILALFRSTTANKIDPEHTQDYKRVLPACKAEILRVTIKIVEVFSSFYVDF